MFHGLGMLVFWIIIFYLILTIFSKDKNEIKEEPLDILKKRLVKGEINREEYENLKEAILK
jgi:putative membrane protein